MLDKKSLMFGGVFLMANYSQEFKLEVVKYCVEQHNSYKEIIKLDHT